MINSKIQFSFAEIRRGKCKTLIFHYNFLNKDILMTTLDIDMKFCMVLLHTYSEGSVFQFFLFRA